MDEKRIAHFWSRVDKGGADDCWEWRGARNVSGHGVGWDGRRTQIAHRMAWFAAHQRWPTQCLLHRCDNPPCCNPRHLFEGTRADNMRDMWAKGRGVNPPKNHGKGEDHCYVKLTEAQVWEILRGLRNGARVVELARSFAVSESNIYAIRSGRSWAHLDRSRL